MTQQEQQPQHFMAELYRRHERLMYYIAGNYTTDAFQREDIVQAALVALMRNEAPLRTLSEPGPTELHRRRCPEHRDQRAEAVAA